LSPLVWFFLWLPEEVLALLFLLHRENGDFSILMKDILSGELSSFGSWIFYSYFPYPLGFCSVSATFILSGSCNPLFKCILY
jgi:hypothetical protein